MFIHKLFILTSSQNADEYYFQEKVSMVYLPKKT
jgi:hypothetical protein